MQTKRKLVLLIMYLVQPGIYYSRSVGLNGRTYVLKKVCFCVQGKFSRINFREDLYVGGYSNYSLISERTGVDGGLVGCIRVVDVDGKRYDMRRGAFIGDALHGYDIGQ